MNNFLLAERILKDIASSPSTSFAESVKVHLTYLESKLEGFEKFARKLQRFVNEPQQFLDFLTEAHWALVLLEIGVNVQYEPLGESGPDLRMEHSGHLVDFHCKRLRNDSKTTEKLAGYGGRLVEYGNVENDTITIFNRMTAEQPKRIDTHLPQLLAYWSDSERVDEHEFEYAIQSIQTAAADGQLCWLSCVIYKVRIFKKFKYWYNPYSSVPIPNTIQLILEKMEPWPNVANYT